MALEEQIKQRLLGGAVLVALVVIFVPMLIDEPVDSKVVSDHQIPRKPETVENSMPSILPPPPVADSVPGADTDTEKQTQAKPTVPIPLPEPKPRQGGKPSPTAWIIQVASLTVKKNAEKLVAELRQAELPAILEQVEVDGKRHYRVRVGPEVSHKTASSMAERIQRDFKLTPKILHYPD